jgi:hypothetical protein
LVKWPQNQQPAGAVVVIAHRDHRVATPRAAAGSWIAVSALILGLAVAGQAKADRCVCTRVHHRAVYHHPTHTHIYHHYYHYAAAYPPPPEPLYYEDYYAPPPAYYGPAYYGYDYAVPLAFGLGALAAGWGHHPYYGWGGHGRWAYGGGYYRGFHGGGLHRGWSH